MHFLFTFFLLLFFFTKDGWAQKGITLQAEPGLSFTQKFQGRWSFNGKSTVRYTFLTPEEEGIKKEATFNFNETLLFATYEFWNNVKVSGGYGFRISTLSESHLFSEHRIMQQFGAVLYARGGKRIANRLRLEQRIEGSDYINRWRYRIGFDSPLNGQRLDPGEMYIILTNELLWSFNRIEQNGENRLYAGVGWFFNSQYKLETGLQYRASDLGPDMANTLWFTTLLYINRMQPQKKQVR